jgi:hypothetical protein
MRKTVFLFVGLFVFSTAFSQDEVKNAYTGGN